MHLVGCLLLLYQWCTVTQTSRSHGTTRFLLDGLAWNLKFDFFKHVQNIKVPLIPDNNDGYFVNLSRLILFGLRFVSIKCCRGNQNIHFMINTIIFRKSCLLWDNVDKCCAAVQANERGGTVVEVLCYKSEGRWFDPSLYQWIFHWHKILSIALCPWGRLRPLTEMSTRSISWGKGGRCVRLTTLAPFCAVVMKSGNFNLLETSEPLQACNGTALPFYRAG